MLVHIFPGQKNDPTFPRDQYNNDGMPEYTLTPDRLVLDSSWLELSLKSSDTDHIVSPLSGYNHPHRPHRVYHILNRFRLNQLRQQKLYPFDDKVALN